MTQAEQQQTELDRQWGPYVGLLPYPDFAQALAAPLQLFPETVRWVIPSIVLGTDGPKLESIFLVSDHLLAEVRSVSGPSSSFDFVERRRMWNYRVTLGTHEVARVDGDAVIYQTASIDVNHGGIGFTSELKYAGRDIEAWLDVVTKAVPIGMLFEKDG